MLIQLKKEEHERRLFVANFKVVLEIHHLHMTFNQLEVMDIFRTRIDQ